MKQNNSNSEYKYIIRHFINDNEAVFISVIGYIEYDEYKFCDFTYEEIFSIKNNLGEDIDMDIDLKEIDGDVIASII